MSYQDVVKAYRDAGAGARRIRAYGRRERGAQWAARAVSRYEAEQARAVRALLDQGARELVGALVHEGNLAARAATARGAHQDRPELLARLAVARREVRALAAGGVS